MNNMISKILSQHKTLPQKKFNQKLNRISNSDEGVKNKKNKVFLNKTLTPQTIKRLKKAWLKKKKEFARIKAVLVRVKRCHTKILRSYKKRPKRRKFWSYDHPYLQALLAKKMKSKEFYPKSVIKLFKKRNSKRTPVEIKWLYTVRNDYLWDNSTTFGENLKRIRNNLSFKWYLYKLRSPRFLTTQERIRSGYYFKDGRFTLPTTFDHKNKRLPIHRKSNKRLRGFFTFWESVLGNQNLDEDDDDDGTFGDSIIIRKANLQLNLDPYAPDADEFGISSKFSIKNAFDLNQISFFNDKNKYFNEKQTWGFKIKNYKIPRTFYYNLCASFFFRRFFGFSNYKKLKNHRFSFSGQPNALSSFMRSTNQRPALFLLSRGWFSSKYTFKYLYGMGNVLWFPGNPGSSYFRRHTFWKNRGPVNRYDGFYSVGDVFALTPINLIYNNFKLTMGSYYKKRFNSRNVGRFRRNYWIPRRKNPSLNKNDWFYGAPTKVSYGGFKKMIKRAREYINTNMYKRKFKHPGLWHKPTHHPKWLYPNKFKTFNSIYTQSLNGYNATYGSMFEPEVRRYKSPKFTRNHFSQVNHPLGIRRYWRYRTFRRKSFIKDYYIGNFSNNFFKKKNPSFSFYSSFFKNKTRFFGMRSLLTNPSLFKTKALFLSKLDRRFRGIKYTLLSCYTGMRFDTISFLFSFYAKSPIFKYFINEVVYGSSGAWHILENITKRNVDYSLYLDPFGLSVIKHWYTFIQSFVSGNEADLHVDISKEKSIKFIEPNTNPTVGLITSGFFLDFISKDPLVMKGYIRKEQDNLYKSLKRTKKNFLNKKKYKTNPEFSSSIKPFGTTYLLRNYFKKLDYTNFLNCYKYVKTLENLSNYLQNMGLVSNKGLLSKALSDKFFIDKVHRINHNMSGNEVPSKLSSTHKLSDVTYTKLSNRYIFKTNTNKFKRMSTFGKWFKFLFEQNTQPEFRLPTNLLDLGFPQVFKDDMLNDVGNQNLDDPSDPVNNHPAFTNFLKTTQKIDQSYIHGTRSLYYKSFLDYFKNGKIKSNQFFFNNKFMFGDRVFRDLRKLQYMNHDYYYRHLVGTRAFSRFSQLDFKFDPYLNEVYNGYDFNTFEDLLPFYRKFDKWVLLGSAGKLSKYFFRKYFSKKSLLYKNKKQVGYSLRDRRGYRLFGDFFKKHKFLKSNKYTPKFSKLSTVLYEHFFFKQFLNNKFRRSMQGVNFIKLKRKSMSHYIKNFWRKYFVKLMFIDRSQSTGVTSQNTLLPTTVNYERYINNLQINYYPKFHQYLNGQFYGNFLRKQNPTYKPVVFSNKIMISQAVTNFGFNIFDNKNSLFYFNCEFFEFDKLDFIKFFKNYFVYKNFYSFLIPLYTVISIIQKHFNFYLFSLSLNQIVYLLISTFQNIYNKQHSILCLTR